MTNKGFVSVCVVVLITAVLAVYTFIGVRWWVAQKERISVINQWIQIGLSLVVVALVIVAPLFAIGLSIDKLKSVSGVDIGSDGRFVLFLGWIMPTGVYTVMYFIRKKRPKR